MAWINFFESDNEKRCSFGRGINADISPDEEELFNDSYLAFENKKMLDAYEFFFRSLENFYNKSSNNNIIIEKNNETLKFTLFQGLAKVQGVITQETLYAEVVMLKAVDANVALKRYILERNYQFTYAHYFSDSKHTKLKIFFHNETMSPQKIFFPIRELALNADFDKEFMKSEFPEVELEEISHIQNIEESEARVKYQFLQTWISEVEEKALTLPSNDKAGMEAFLYMNLIFKIDYLLVPKFNIYQKISKKVQTYFSEDELSIESKNEEIKRYVDELKEISFEEFNANLYDSKYTFSQNEKSSFEELTIFLNESLKKVRWYKSNRYNQIIPTLYSYVSFYALYNYGMNPVLKTLLHLLVTIRHPEFFGALEYKIYYDRENDSLLKRDIKSKIEEIVKRYQKEYKLLKPFGDKLNFESLNEFSNSFYTQIKNLNFEES